MIVAIGSDHAGVTLKTHLIGELTRLGHEALDLGTHGVASVDYPAYCAAVARAVTSGRAQRGIVLGGSGQGEQLAANTVLGARAALCNDLYTARMSRQHNDANVLAMGGRIVAEGLATEILELWLSTPFEGGRHVRRVEQLQRLAELATDPAAQDAYIADLLGSSPESASPTQTEPRPEGATA